MVEEIIYTSAEKGLKQGSRGFCTVVSTSGMALNLAERLESMSGYRQAFPLNDPQSSLNPVNYSHVTMRLAGKKLHVLSRVADAGQDYTGRSNKLAHHIVIDSVASLTPGPARLLADASVIVDRWDGVVRHIPPRELPTPSIPSTIQLSAWKAICGDGGWAGSVAEQLLQNPAPLSVIFGAGTDTLSLVREVLDLVPALQRWNVTFSTYFTRLLAGAECQLRFVLNDTPDATALRNDARARVVDLTKPLPAASGGALVTIARSGELTPQEPAPAAPTTRTAIQPKENAAAASPKAAVLPVLPRFGQPTIGDGTVDLPEIPFPANRSRRKLKLVVALLLFTTVTGTLVATVMFLGKGGKPDKFSEIVANTVPADSQQSIEDSKPAAEKARLGAEAAKAEEVRVAAVAAKAEEVRVAAVAAKAEEVRVAAVAAEKIRVEEVKKLADKMLSDADWEKQGPFVFIRRDETRRDSHGQWLFELPKPGEDIEPKPLPLSVKDQNVELALFEGAKHLFAGSPYKLELIQSPDDPNKWIAKANEIELAEYTIERIDSASDAERTPDRLVHFQWLSASSREIEASELLRWWPLLIRVGERSAVLLQRSAFRPETVPSWKTLVESKAFSFATGVEIKALPLSTARDMHFDVVIAQKESEPQRISLKVNPEFADDEEASGGEESDTKPTPAIRYFSLTVPLRLTDNQPSVDKDLLGFGTIQMQVSHAGKAGLTFDPRLTIAVRIPKKEELEDLPGLSTNQFLIGIVEDPTRILTFNPELTSTEIERLNRDCEALRTVVIKWHTQPLRKLPRRDSFLKLPFFQRKEEAVKAVQKGVQETPMPDDKKASKEENKKRRTIHAFIPDMNNMETVLKANIETLMHDYGNISIHIEALQKASVDFIVCCELVGFVAAPGTDNIKDDVLRVFFLESTSEQAR